MSWIGMDCVKGCGGSWTCDPEVGGAVGLRAAARAAEDSREAVSEKGGVARCRAWRMCLGILASFCWLVGGVYRGLGVGYKGVIHVTFGIFVRAWTWYSGRVRVVCSVRCAGAPGGGSALVKMGCSRGKFLGLLVHRFVIFVSSSGSRVVDRVSGSGVFSRGSRLAEVDTGCRIFGVLSAEIYQRASRGRGLGSQCWGGS